MEEGLNGKKVCKQVRDERNMETNKRLKYFWKIKINPKVFAIPVLTALTQCGQNRDSKCFRFYVHSPITLELFIIRYTST